MRQASLLVMGMDGCTHMFKVPNKCRMINNKFRIVVSSGEGRRVVGREVTSGRGLEDL